MSPAEATHFHPCHLNDCGWTSPASGAAALVNVQVLAWLVADALNDLFRADGERGCCNICCGPCAALKILWIEDRLNDAVRPVAEGYVWWLDGKVDEMLLNRAWRMTDCHAGLIET